MNSINLIGNLGQDPDVKYFESGKVLATFSIAVRNLKGESDWFDVEVWGKPAQIAVDYLKKGSKVGITGYVKIDSYEKDGQKRKAWKVNVNQLTLLDSKSQKADTAYDNDVF